MNKLFKCISKSEIDEIPIWFMRQAGRYLPEFRKIRQQNPDFIKLCLNPNLVKTITLQPIKRFKLDATIIFSDILMIPYGLGQNVRFEKGIGPKLEKLNLENTLKTSKEDFEKKLTPVYEGLKKVKEETKRTSLIGFVGAPWTLLVYMLNEKSPKKDFTPDKILSDEIKVKRLMDKIIDATFIHINKQVSAGANVIQIFDSWAELIPDNKFDKYCLEPTKKIVDYVKSLKVPVICFPKGIGINYEKFCLTVKPDCISIDYNIDPNWIIKKSNGIAIQGGMDPKILLEDNKKIEYAVKKYLKTFSGYPYIFNLGHGVLPATKPEKIEFVIKTIRQDR